MTVTKLGIFAKDERIAQLAKTLAAVQRAKDNLPDAREKSHEVNELENLVHKHLASLLRQLSALKGYHDAQSTPPDALHASAPVSAAA